mgnify:CR=1 FL=1
MIKISYQDVLPYLTTILETGGIVFISDIHGSTNGPNLASRLVEDTQGNNSKYLLLEVPGEHTNQNTDSCLNAYYNFTAIDKDLSFDRVAMDNLVDKAVNNGWQIRASDCARYIATFGRNGVRRQDYIARQIKLCHQKSTGVIAVNGTKHLSGQRPTSYTASELKRLRRSGLAHFSGLSYLLSGIDGRLNNVVKIFNVSLPSTMRSLAKRIEVHTIPFHLVQQTPGYEGGNQGL